MAVNKVIYGGNTLVDLTGDTVTAADLADGVKATGADGNPVVGIMQKVTIDSQLSGSSTNPVQNYVLNRKFNTILLPNGQLSTPSSNDAYLCKLAADALSSINDITQMTIEQSADGETWEMLFDSDTASDKVKLAYLYGLKWPTTIYITKGYMARVTFATHTTTYFANISMYLKAICDSGNQASYKCYVGFNTLKDNAQLQDTINTWGSWPSSVFTSVGYNIVRYVFNEDKQADLNLWFDGAQCKGTVLTRNVLRFDAAKQITTTPFGIQAPTFNGYTIGASVPANAKFTDTVYTHPSTHPANMITGLSTVATSGSYNDLTDKPTIPASATVDSELSSTSTNPVQNKAIYNALLNKVGTDIFSGFALMGATSTITWRQGSNSIGSINATNYTGTAARATQDGAGNVITETYATKSDISGVVKSVNGVTPDDAGNVTIAVSGGGGSGDYLPLTGGTVSGGITANNFQTGTATANYFQCRKFRGEGDANSYYHAIDFGYSGHDSVDFYEYDPNWNFYKCLTGTKSGAVLVGNINGNGWNGGARLTGAPTAPTAAVGTNTTQIATTAFVQAAVGGKANTSDLANFVTTSGQNTWRAQQIFNLATLGYEQYSAPYSSTNSVSPSTSAASYYATGAFTLNLSTLSALLGSNQSTVFSAYITASGDYALSITNGGTVKYIGEASDVAITSAGLLLNILMTKDNSGTLTSIVQANKLT